MPVYTGRNAKILFQGEELGHAKNVTIEIDRSLEPYYEIFSRKASKILESTEMISGKLEKAWVDTTYLSLLTGGDTLSTFDLAVKVPGNAILHLYKCKFGKNSVPVPQDGFLMENYEFFAKNYTIQALEAGPELTLLLNESWVLGPPSVIPLLHSEAWTLKEQPTFTLKHSESWSE